MWTGAFSVQFAERWPISQQSLKAGFQPDTKIGSLQPYNPNQLGMEWKGLLSLDQTEETLQNRVLLISDAGTFLQTSEEIHNYVWEIEVFFVSNRRKVCVEWNVIYEALCFDAAQGRMNRAPNETRTHSCRFASQAC